MQKPLRARSAWVIAVVASAVATGAAAQGLADDPAWRVEQRFRLFKHEDAPKFGPAPKVSEVEQRLDDLGRATEEDLRVGFVGAPDTADKHRVASYQAVRDLMAAKLDGQPLFKATHWSVSGSYADKNLEKKVRQYDGRMLTKPYAVRAGFPTLQGWTCTWSLTGETLAPLPCEAAVVVPFERDKPALVNVKAVSATGTPRTIALIARLDVDTDPAGAAADAHRLIVKDRLIVGFGESYAAGEGDPDKPTDWRDIDDGAILKAWREDSYDLSERWWHDRRVIGSPDAKPDAKGIKPAEWWDPYCHRSLWGQHAQAALLYSARHPQQAVTFVSFACAGAKVFDGLVARQVKPPGDIEFGVSGKRDDNLAQVEQFLRLVCPTYVRTAPGAAGLQTLLLDATDEERKLAASTQLTCGESTARRRPDVVLVSLGGNDVGFGGAIFDAVIPDTPKTPAQLGILPLLRDAIGTLPPQVVNNTIERRLPALYGIMREALRRAVGASSRDTDVMFIQTAYIDPLHDRRGGICEGFEANRAFTVFRGVPPDRYVPPRARWAFELTREESLNVAEALHGPLNARIAAGAGGNWYVADRFVPITKQHGWCALGESHPTDATVGLPYFDVTPAEPGKYAWARFNPRTDWNAYAPRARYIRTPNDAVLTQVGSRKPLLAIFPLGPLTAAGGAFHPTAEAYHLMAYELADRIERGPGP
jgi:hypothetical protein